MSLVCAGHQPRTRLRMSPGATAGSPDGRGRATRFLDTRPPGTWSGGLSHRERSGPCGPGLLPNPKPSGLGSVAGGMSAACSLGADYP